ncbi:MAG: hypothetical protein K2I06_12140 [Ruminococcus sp.]|nr:hypothetical protein [Ruminococcus sp.]
MTINIKKEIALMISLLSFLVIISPQNLMAYDYISYGIDVSKYQGNINWSYVASDNVQFAIIRAGTTAINGEKYSQDAYFESNYSGAKRYGLNVGAYYYCGAYSEQGFINSTNALLESISGKQFEYPVFIDIEEANKQIELGKETLTSYILTALSMIKDAGYTCGVYANKNWFTNYIDIERIKNAGYEIWWAQYPSGTHAVEPTEYDKSDTCNIWQYSSKGSINGISGDVDVDVSYKEYAPAPVPIDPVEPEKPEKYYPACSPELDSIIDALKSIGVNSDFSYRERIAAANNIQDYKGTSEQNILMLSLLKDGKLINPEYTKQVTETTTSQTTTTATTIQTTTTTTATTADNSDSIKIVPDEITIKTGESVSLAVINCDNPENIKWISNNSLIAKVDNGVVTAISKGSAKIYAAYNNSYVEVIVNVEAVKGIEGDIDIDGRVTMHDIYLLNSYILGSAEDFTGENFKAADINNDGNVDSFDMVMLRKIAVDIKNKKEVQS